MDYSPLILHKLIVSWFTCSLYIELWVLFRKHWFLQSKLANSAFTWVNYKILSGRKKRFEELMLGSFRFQKFIFVPILDCKTSVWRYIRTCKPLNLNSSIFMVKDSRWSNNSVGQNWDSGALRYVFSCVRK